MSSGQVARELLVGAIDTHVHTAPDVVPRRLDDGDAVRQAANAGMRAIVLKSHHTATGDRAQLAEQAQGGRIAVRGGIALDDAVGGLNPAAIEASARLGGLIVWLPTTCSSTFLRWSAANAAAHPFDEVSYGIDLLDSDGGPLAALLEVLDAVAAHRQILATGHLAAAEIEMVVSEARARRIERIVVTHPEHPYVGLSHAAQQELAHAGVWFERCYLAYPTQAGSAAPVAASIAAVGASSTVLATDFGQAHNLPPVEGYQEFLRRLLELGVASSDLRLMSATNPAALLEL